MTMPAAKPFSLKSMTGYAQAHAEQDGWLLRVSVRSVNHRFLDLHIRLPEGFESFESGIRQQVRGRIRRAHVDVILRVEPAGPAAVHVNRELAAAYARAAEELRQQFPGSGGPDFVAILRLPGVVAAAGLPSGPEQEEELERVSASVAACLAEALEKLDDMRQAEGLTLANEMRARLRRLEEHVRSVAEMAERLRPAFARRLEQRLKELLGGASLDPTRLAQEAALLAERSDITEEITRLGSHIQQFDKLLDSGGDAGKKLDFLLQEMQREANTMLSKTPGVEADGIGITSVALEMKSEIERLREQIQNVE